MLWKHFDVEVFFYIRLKNDFWRFLDRNFGQMISKARSHAIDQSCSWIPLVFFHNNNSVFIDEAHSFIELQFRLTLLLLQQLKENRNELNARIDAKHRYIFDRLTMMLGLEMSTIQESFLSSDQVSNISTISLVFFNYECRAFYGHSWYFVKVCITRHHHS